MSNPDLVKGLSRKLKDDQPAKVAYDGFQDIVAELKQVKTRKVPITFHVDEVMDEKLCEIAHASRQSKSRVIQKLLIKALGQ